MIGLNELETDYYPVTTAFALPSTLPSPRSEALPFTHAHNDYEHTFPLFEALSYGFVSVEADIWLYPEDGENLRVAHDPVEDPTTLPTLEELYLDPLQALKEDVNNGGVYADGTPLTLLIDLKSEGLSTYQRLHEVLEEYQAESPGLFTTYTQDEQGNYIVNPGAVTPIISGDRPREYMEDQELRYAGYDGRKSDIGADVDPGFMPLISDNWNNFFSGELAWDGIGTIPEDTEAALSSIISEVQAEDKIVRFWNLPQDAPSVWGPLYEAGVDLINTDDLEGLASFIDAQLPMPAGVFNFAFIPFDQDLAQAGNLSVEQLGTGNDADEVVVSLESSTADFFIDSGSNRGDYNVRVGSGAADDALNGIYISSIRENGRDHGQGQGVQFGTSAIATNSDGRVFIPLSESLSGEEYNANVAVAYFPYSDFTGGWARTDVNGGPFTALISGDLTLGKELTTIESGAHTLTLPGVNTLTDGILLTVGGKNEDNYGASRPTLDGTGYILGVHDNGSDGGGYEQDAVGFVFLEKDAPATTDLTFGRVLSDGSTPVAQGDFAIEVLDEGVYKLTIEGATPADGALVLSAEGFDLKNNDNIVSYEATEDGWIIQSRDINLIQGQTNLQDVGTSQVVDVTTLPKRGPIDPAFAGAPVEAILEAWQDATVDHSFIVAHRAGYYENGVINRTENSLSAIENAIALGADMVELDVRQTADGHFVIIHDETVDRTTTGAGAVSDLTLEEIKALNLVVEGTGEITDEKVPTLEEALAAVDGRILFNVDNKTGVENLAPILDIAQSFGVDDQIVLKSSINDAEDIEEVKATLSTLPADAQIDFMPIIRDNVLGVSEETEAADLALIRQIFEEFTPNAVEILVRPGVDDLVEDGGFLFSDPVLALAEEFDVRLWMNVIFARPYPRGDLNGFRGDYLALTEPEAVFNFWANEGVTIYQTDETLLAADYLNSNGFRASLTADTIVGTESSDTLAGGLGNDIISGGGGDDVLRGDLNSQDSQIGVGGDDLIYGGAGSDRIGGKGGNDQLFGDAGDDHIWGDDGDDILRGNLGNDILTGDDASGGSGSDTFVLAVGEGTDTITDFEVGIDVIGLADGLTFGMLAFSGNTINAGNETLAILQGVNTITLAESSFVVI